MGGIDEAIDPIPADPVDHIGGTGEGPHPEMRQGNARIGECRRLRHHTDADLETLCQQGLGYPGALAGSGQQPEMPLAIPRLVHQDGALLQRVGRR